MTEETKTNSLSADSIAKRVVQRLAAAGLASAGDEQWRTTQQLAHAAGVCEATVRRWHRQGAPLIDVGGGRLRGKVSELLESPDTQPISALPAKRGT